ncbi:MAG TPA: enoyl-CoA hydratase/isomerase family protein [Aliidongia sp.]|uniref:enoyl-CoA hydratase/isomerase family protein n=1 Tax=Aliidongia sp. TaxID=1914230 RepID=UPI002DDD27E6|nr:enoyl-CoA hydratase/isomerase family protein [Aliidongia sp.]HEV2677551.1 enoyl-CoA hydratase/isomerase family protein [Aliidongia sp.]
MQPLREDSAGSGPFDGAAMSLDWPHPGVARARFIRPAEMNTLSFEFLAELGRVIDTAETGRARVLIFTGEGSAFCAGAHLKYFTDPESPLNTPIGIRDRYLVPITRLFDRLEAASFVTIAAINGHALGGGFELALSCDLRVIATSARVGLTEVRVGAFPAAGGVQKLHRLIGRGKALELILLGRQIAAAEADRLGLAYAVVEPDDLPAATLALAQEVLRGGRFAVAQAKANIYLSENVDLKSARDFGLESLTVLAGSTDWAEGMAAFVEKRKPRFE